MLMGAIVKEGDRIAQLVLERVSVLFWKGYGGAVGFWGTRGADLVR